MATPLTPENRRELEARRWQSNLAALKDYLNALHPLLARQVADLSCTGEAKSWAGRSKEREPAKVPFFPRP